MAELVIRVKDSPLKGDPVFDSKASRRGDVIQVFEDGFIEATCSHEGSAVRTHDFWRVLLLPNVPYKVALVLEAMEPAIQPVRANRTTHFRLHTFHLEHPILSPGLRAYLADDTRAAAWFVAPEIDEAAFALLFSRKPPIPDPGTV